MNNLIKNSQWCPGPDGGPQYFSGTGSTYDDFCLNGYRTCSITMKEDCGMTGTDVYDPAINVCGQKAISWGYCMRAIDADCILLGADFYDASCCLIDTMQKDITCCVTCQFCQQMVRFSIPCYSETVHLYMLFKGRITACTFCCPTAYFC